jgi:parallel beta-helix repeat protein
VFVESGPGHVVEGNRLGTTADGAGVLGGTVGVLLDGTGTEVRDNLIAGENNGVQITSDDNVVQGNLIGTDADGDAALPNFHGVNVVGGDRNLIGGAADGDGNVVSGNDQSGVQITTVDDDVARVNRVEGNLIGTTAAGDAALGNGDGVLVHESDDNTIEANVIAGNDDDGVRLDAADGNVLLGNWIGTDRTAARDLGNGESGVDIDGALNRVGEALETGSMNTIANNGEDGVTVSGGSGNAIVRNAIRANGGLAIDLGADGGTGNDPDDSDAGANGLQNGPEISDADATSVEWSLDSAPTTSYRLEFYANPACSGSSVTEAETYLGSQVVTTDVNGNADGATVTPIAAGAGVHVSMTATKLFSVLPGLPPALRSTSEVSPCEATS